MQKIVTLALLCALGVPVTNVEARHNRYSVDTSDLDDDIVEELPIPVLFGVSLNDITPDFGDPRGGGTREHEGQDMLAPKGTPIVSPTEAIVTSTGTGDSAGKYVYTVNPGGERFRYMHLDYIADLDRGDKLDVGDFIGTVGDTGNAPDGVYHLHFETRDEDNDAQDPYERLVDDFSLREKVSFLEGIFDDIRNDEEYAGFLVSTFRDEFRTALNAGYDLPDEITEALEDSGVVSDVDAYERLREVLAVVPELVTVELSVGDTGPRVMLLQLYLMYNTSGTARSQLATAGPTGYYGSITANAVSAYQTAEDLDVTGVYDSQTRLRMRSN